MKTTENQEKVLNFLEKSPKSSADNISIGTGIFKLQVFKLLKPLVEEKQIEMDEEANPPVYSLRVKTPKAEQTKTPVKIALQESKGNDEESSIKTFGTGRDTRKLKFQGQEYGKGPLVLAVVKAHVEKNPRITLPKLKELFPDELQPRYGTIQEVSKARKLSEGRDRFFLKPEQLLKIGDKKIAVCNQWGSHNIQAFLKVAKGLNFVVK